MSKNKRYKRLAKRILGECIYHSINSGHCAYCKSDKKGYCECIIINGGNIPWGVGIRTIERICKYGK